MLGQGRGWAELGLRGKGSGRILETHLLNQICRDFVLTCGGLYRKKYFPYLICECA